MENRKLNTTDVLGMDLRDFSTDQQHVKEIINLKHEKDGWRIKDSSRDFLTGLLSTEDINDIYDYDTDKVLIHKDNDLYLYYVSNDQVSTFLEKYEFDFSFKLWNTSYPKRYLMADTTNHKTYELVFTDKVMIMNDDTGDLTQSTEYLLHQYDIDTQDLEWYAMCKHDTVDENDVDWTEGLDKYCINYDQIDDTSKMVALLQQINYTYNIARLITLSQEGTTGVLRLFPFDKRYPEMYEKKVEFASTTFISSNKQSLYCDVDNGKYEIAIGDYSKGLTNTPQTSYEKYISDMIVFNRDIFIACGGGKSSYYGGGIKKINKNTDTWYDVSNGLGATDRNCSALYEFNNVLYCGICDPSWVYDESGPYIYDGNTWTIFTTGLSSAANGTNTEFISFNNILHMSTLNGVWYLNSSTWTNKSTGLTGNLYVYCLGIFNNLLYCGSGIGNIFYWNGSTWVSQSTGLTSGSFSDSVWSLISYASSFYAGTTHGVYKLIGTTWTVFNTGLHTGAIVYKLYVSTNEIYACTNAGLYTNNGSTWVKISSNEIGTYNLRVILKYNNDLYVGSQGNGILKCINEYISQSYLYYNSITSIPKIIIKDYSDTYTLNNGITAGVLNVKSIKCMNLIFDDNGDIAAKYIIVMDEQQLKVFLTEKVGTLTNIETASVSTTAALVSITSQYFPNFHSMHLIKNNYYENSNSNKRGFSLVIYYDYYFQIVDFWLWNDAASAKTLQYTVQTAGTSLDKDLLSNNMDQCWMWGIQNATLYTGGQTHYLYINKDKSIIQIPLTGIVMTSTDITNIKTIYNSEISQKLDPAGCIIGGVETTPSGYELTEINLSKPAAVRPYFTPDTDDTIYDTTVAVENQSDDNDAFSDWNLYGATLSNTNNYKVYWDYVVNNYSSSATGNVNIITGSSNVYGNGTLFASELLPNLVVSIGGVGKVINTITNNTFMTVKDNFSANGNSCAMLYTANYHVVNIYSQSGKTNGYEVLGGKWNVPNSCSLVVSFTVKNSSAFTTSYCNVILTTGLLGNVDDTDEANMLQLGIPNFELFNMYEMVTTLPNGGTANFRTPIEIDSGSDVIFNSDDSTTFHKYWIFGFLNSGLVDKDIPYILLAKGEMTPGTNNYNLTYWKQDEFSNLIQNSPHLPHWFSNSETNDNSMTAGVATDTDKIYIVNDKLFYKQGDQYRDKFESSSYWQQNKNVLFETQDVAITGNLKYLINYDKKSAYYGTGFKYINMFNELNLESKPTAIQPIDMTNGIIGCENNFYYVSGTGENNVILTKIISGVGLEKDNWKSLITNGKEGFFYNKKGIWMIKDGQVINISDPLTNRIYKQSSGNVLSYDYSQNCLLIPLDYTKFTALKVQLMSGDYGTTAQTIEYDNIIALFNVQELSYRLYAFIDDQSGYTNFMGNYKEHPIIRVGSKLIIPEYSEAIGTENPLCRFWTKRMTFGNDNEMKKLDSFWATIYNQANIAATTYGIDYFKIYMIIDNSTIWSKKYGDFKGSGYTDCDVGKVMSPTNSTNGFTNINFRFPNIDFHNIQIMFEFARLKDTNISNASLSYIMLDIINKAFKSRGVR